MAANTGRVKIIKNMTTQPTRELISKILIKYGMPTRQMAITEILELIEKRQTRKPCFNCELESNKAIIVDDVMNPHCTVCGRKVDVEIENDSKVGDKSE